MPWSKILVIADMTDDGLARLALAGALASEENATLEAQVVALAPLAPYGIGAGAMADVYADARTGAHEAGAIVAARVKVAAEKVANAVVVEQQDVVLSDVRARIAALAHAADLVVLGKPESQDRSDIDSEALVGALMGAGAPVLMLPRWISPRPWGRRVVIAWKGAPEAARAVHAALPLLTRADTVRIVVVGSRGDYFGEGQASVGRLSRHLAHHGVKLEPASFREKERATFRAASEEPGPEILSEAEAMGADLLVMGGYGRARMSEIVFGGVTRDVIRSATIPVFLTR